MEGIPISSLLVLLFAVILPVGLIGVGAFLFVRQSLDRILDRDSDTFESRVLDELEVLRMSLDRISERLDAAGGEASRQLERGQDSLPSSSVGEGNDWGDEGGSSEGS